MALARVVGVEGSGPRLPGAAMAVSEAGEVAGSVSGGCVEGAVVTEALEVLAGDGRPRLCTFGYSDDEAFAVGLTCGGTIHVFVEPLGLVTTVRSIEAPGRRHRGPSSRSPWPTVVEGPTELLGGQAAGPARAAEPAGARARSAIPTSTGSWRATPWASWQPG